MLVSVSHSRLSASAISKPLSQSNHVIIFFLAVVHHGYGHSSRDRSTCTEAIKRAYFINGTLPSEAETNCYADSKPYPADSDKILSHPEWLHLLRSQ